MKPRTEVSVLRGVEKVLETLNNAGFRCSLLSWLVRCFRPPTSFSPCRVVRTVPRKQSTTLAALYPEPPLQLGYR